MLDASPCSQNWRICTTSRIYLPKFINFSRPNPLHLTIPPHSQFPKKSSSIFTATVPCANMGGTYTSRYLCLHCQFTILLTTMHLAHHACHSNLFNFNSIVYLINNADLTQLTLSKEEPGGQWNTSIKTDPHSHTSIGKRGIETSNISTCYRKGPSAMPLTERLMKTNSFCLSGWVRIALLPTY